MKNYCTALIAISTLLMISNFSYGQNKKYVPEKGFWELVNNVRQKTNTIVQFYDDDCHLIYQETIAGRNLNVKRKKTLKILKESLEKVIEGRNKNSVMVNNGNIVALMMHKKKYGGIK